MMNKRIFFLFLFFVFCFVLLNNKLRLIRFSAMEAVRNLRRYTVKNLASQDNRLTYNFKYCMVLKYISPLEFRFRWRNYTPKNLKNEYSVNHVNMQDFTTHSVSLSLNSLRNQTPFKPYSRKRTSLLIETPVLFTFKLQTNTLLIYRPC